MEQNREDMDLFDTIDEEGVSANKLKHFFRTRKEAVVMMSVENLTVIVAILCVILVIVFYLGFVRGQGVTHDTLKSKLRMLRSKQELVRKTYPVHPSVIPKSPSAPPPVGATPEMTTTYSPNAAVEKSVDKPYTIQVVAYRNSAQAQKEIQKLQAKGYETRVITQGSYFIVCVGQYRSRVEAEKDMAELRRDYHDGYLRKF
jgi:cell division protein FtsN